MQDGDARISGLVCNLTCHCEERSDEAISIKFDVLSGIASLPTVARNDKKSVYDRPIDQTI